MLYSSIRHILNPLKNSIIHPQWLVYRYTDTGLQEIANHISNIDKKILDIGCADKKLHAFLPNDCDYIGLDYYFTATEHYGTVPDIFGDAQLLPFATESLDYVTLLDVLEHLPNPENCIAEVKRILKPGGTFFLQVPFVYPIHDAPLDFQRWSIFGLRRLLAKHKFSVTEEKSYGQPTETAALIGNIALSQLTLNLLERKNPFGLLILPFVTLAIPSCNFIGWLLAKISSKDTIMPYGYRFICQKPSCPISL